MRKSMVGLIALLSLIALAAIVFRPVASDATALIPRQSGPQPIGPVGTHVSDPVQFDEGGELVIGEAVTPDVSPPLRDIPVPPVVIKPDSEVREMGEPGETDFRRGLCCFIPPPARTAARSARRCRSSKSSRSIW